MNYDDIRKRYGLGSSDDESDAREENSTQTSTSPYDSIRKRYGITSPRIPNQGNTSDKKEEEDKTPTFDYETGKKGWEKYQEDQSSAEQKKANEREDESFWDKLGRWLGDTGPADTTLPLGSTPQLVHDVRNDTSYTKPSDNWSDEQRYEFGALYLESPEKAYAYAEKTNNANNRAKEEAEIKKVQDSATSNGWAGAAHTAGAIASAGLGLADYLNMLVLSNAGRDPLESDGVVSPFEYSTAVTEGIGTHLNETYGTLDEDIPIFGGKGWGDVYGLGTSIAQSFVSGHTLGPAGILVSYFGQGAASGMKDALERGASEWQAARYGAALGAFEGVAESIGIDNLFKLGSSSTIKGLLKNILQQAKAEGLEEGLTSVLSNIADAWIMQDKSNFNAMLNAYMEAGMSEKNAKWAVFWDSLEGIAFDMIAGAASGGIHGGLETGIQTGKYSSYVKNAFGGQVEDLLIEAGQAATDETGDAVDKYINKYGEKGKLSGMNIAHLLEITDTAKVKSAAETRLTQLGEKGNISQLADILTKQVQGMELSKSEQKLLDESTYGQRVANELNPENIRSGEYATNWSEQIGTRTINPKEYNKGKNVIAEDFPNKLVTKGVPEESKYKSSESGKTTLKDQEVSIQGIESIEGGEVTVRLENGEVVNASDLEFGSQHEALMYDIVARMDATPETANSIFNTIKPVSTAQASMYYTSVPLAYEYGKINHEAGLKNINLPKSVKNAIFTRGRIDAMIQAEKNMPKTDSAKKGSVKTNKKGIIYEGGYKYHEASATPLQKSSMQVIEFINAVSNLEVHIYESKLENGKRVAYVDGKAVYANGYFKDGNKIYIDINAGQHGEGLMLDTLGHEVTHYIRENDAKGFKAIADFLIEQYGKKGVNVEALLESQRKKIRNRYAREGAALPSDAKLNDMAYEELVADAMSEMLSDPKAYDKLAKLKQQNRSAWETLRDAIKNILDKIKSILDQYKSEKRKVAKDAATPEANAVRDFSADAYEKLQDLYIKAFVEADANYEAMGEKHLKNKDVLFNLRAVETHKSNLEKQYSNDASISLETLTERYNKIIGIWEKLGGELNSKFLNEWNNKVGKDRAFTVFKAQAGYKYNVELSSMCKKGVPLFEAIDTIVKEEVMKELDTKVIGKEEKEILYDLLKTNNFEIPCAICYVEQARQREGVIIDAFLNGKIEKNNAGKTATFKLGWNEVLKAVEKEMKLNGVDYTFHAVDRSIATDKYVPADISMDEATQDAFYNALKKIANKEIARYNKAEGKNRKLVTSITPAAIKEVFKGTLPSNLKIFKVLFTEPSSRFTMESDLLYSSMTTHNLATAHNNLYSLFNSQGGVSGYKTKQGTVVYWGDILGKTWEPSKVRDEGGIRNQSNSDFQMYTLLDQVQMYVDFSAKGYYLQAYTKVLSELKLFGLSRGKINASLIPAVHVYHNADGSIDIETTRAYAGLDKNGNLLFDDIEGINHTEAFMLLEDAEYSKSIGGICIGYSDEHIRKLLDDKRVQQIIGFHDKTDDPDKRYKGAKYAKNYNGLNEAINNKDGKTVHIGFNPYVRKAEKMFTFDAKTETYKGEIEYNGKTYVADDIPKLAADLYLEMCKKKDYTPAYTDFDYHENYYKLLADFSLYDSQGHYAPHRKVAFNMPDSVPYLDINGKKKYMPTKDYIKAELEKELKVRDSISEALADKSETGLIPQFVKRVNESKANQSETKLSDRDSSYLDAVNRGDMVTAQKMVDEAAKKAGYTVRGLHATNAEFTVFDISKTSDVNYHGRGIYFTNSQRDVENNYENYEGPDPWQKIEGEAYELLYDKYGLSYEDTLTSDSEVIDKLNECYDEVIEKFKKTLRRITAYLKFDNPLIIGKRESVSDYDLSKYDGIIDKHVYENIGHSGMDENTVHYIVLNPNNIKSADPVTYDDNGNVIPLSERFDADNNDIRYSDRDPYSYETLTSKPDMKITTLDGTVPSNRADVVFQAKKNAASVGKFNKDGGVLVHVDDTDTDVLLSTDGLKHGLRRTKNLQTEANAIVTLKAGEILKNSIRINELTPSKANAIGSYVLIGSAKDSAGNLYIVRSVVNQFTSELTSMDVLYAINTKKESAVLNAPRSTVKLLSVTDSNISIAHLLEIVNRYFPDILPESVLRHYGYDARPEGNLGENVLYSDRVTDEETLEFLENQEHVTVYRAMQVIDGKLYPPMNAYTKDETGKKVLMPPSEIGEWEQAVERPDLIDPKTGKFKLDKGKVDDGKRGTIIPAAYNPYIHTSASPLNDQFSSAYKRSNLVVVEGEIPASELTSGYRAEFAKDTVGETKWHSGPVAGQLKGDKARRVFLSRWFKPVRIVPDSEVASIVAKTLEGENIDVPYNVVTPSLRTELEKVGVSIKYSERDTETISNRTLLANALETTAKNDIEKNRLNQYKNKIALIESEQAKLTEIRAELRELYFTKGRRDTDKIKSLQTTATQIENRINTYDRQLLKLESTEALKGVLDREKKMAYKKAEQRGKESLRRQKEKDAATVRELMTRNYESRKKATESRNKTAMREKIRKVVNDLNKLLLNPTQDKHVPIGLQKVVAEALDVINMDTMNAEERVAYYNDLISKSNNPDEIAMLKKKRDFFEYRDMNFKDRITSLKSAYAEFKESDDSLIRNAHNDAIEDLIKNTADEVGNKSLKDMSLTQLEKVYDMYKAILATVRNANKMFKEGRQETVTENSNAVKLEVREVGGHKDRVLKMTKFLKKFGWEMLKPVTAMKVIGSKTFERLFNNVRAAEDTWALDVNEAKQFYEDIAAKYGYNKWDLKKFYSLKDGAGADISMTLEQIMSLYAYSKREQADQHLEFGGFIFDDAIEVVEKNKILGIPLKYEVNDANPHRLRKEHILDIISVLTKEQKDFVDAMQTYLSDVMGAKGNEVSLAMYDIKLYKEKNYFPLKTSRYFREFDPEKSGTPKIKNSGFSKKTVPQAGNPIVLSNFMDVWAGHVNDMSMYHAFVLPLEDFMRVYNYSLTAGGYDSVQQYIKNAYGSQANQYIERLLDDLNGGARVDSSAGIINKGLSLFKKASVFASASVVVQQPSAIARALAYINPKYFAKATPEALNIAKHKTLWAEVKKYAPVAIIKEMGYFDTGVGRGTVEWIKGSQTFMDKMDDVLSKAPAIADELCWTHIWEAIKRETQATSNLKVGSEIFLMECGKRFTEVITNTQVYDSVLSRSGMMRSKDTGMKMATAFMAEPTTTVNMMVDGIIQGKRGNKRFTTKTVGAVASSIILNSILVALVYAARDDDEDETYLEKYIGSLTSELLDGFNPLTYIPFVKDIWSIAQGYDVERSDMSVVSNLWESIEGLFDENTSGLEKVTDTAGAIASLFGIPLKNILRDAKGMYNLTQTILSDTPTTGAGIGEAIEDAFKSSIPLWDRLHESDSKADRLYKAIMSGDQDHIGRVKATYKSEQAYETALKSALRENDSRIHEAAQARLDGNISEYTRIAREIIAEGHFSQDTVVAAINSEMSAIKKGESTQTESTDSKDEVTSIYRADDINVAFDNGDTSLALSIIDELVEMKMANGMDEKKAKSSLRSSMTSYWKPLYKQAYASGNTAEMQRIKQILYKSGLYGSATEVIKDVNSWLKN